MGKSNCATVICFFIKVTLFKLGKWLANSINVKKKLFLTGINFKILETCKHEDF